MKRTIIAAVALMTVVILVIPALTVKLFSEKPEQEAGIFSEEEGFAEIVHPSQIPSQIAVKVYRDEFGRVDRLPLEVYVAGVVAAEMPAEFELEALKAQALAARTYTIRTIASGDFADVPGGAHLTDTIKHQVYLDETQLKKLWGLAFEEKMKKIYRAVSETQGKVLTYKGQPINATFFSTSNGYTENSEEYWLTEIPYLRSKESPWDEQSPRFIETVEIPVAEFEQKLGVKLAAEASTGASWSKFVRETTGNRVAEVLIGGRAFTGREVREKLGLNSADFSWEIAGNTVKVTTRGYGHGVGMSQYGANGMAKEGSSAEEIVKYYYEGVDIADYRQWVKL